MMVCIMSASLKAQLTALLTEYARQGQGPFAARVAERRLRVERLTDRELRHHLSMAYGSLLAELERAGLSAFYRKDLGAVVGLDRVQNVIDADKTPLLVVTPSKQPKWKAIATLVGIGVIGLLGLQLNHYNEKAEWQRKLTPLAIRSKEWAEIYESHDTPDHVKEDMKRRMFADIQALPPTSPIWFDVKLDNDTPPAVKERMDDIEEAHVARANAIEESRAAAARRRCFTRGDSLSQYNCLDELGVWDDIDRGMALATRTDRRPLW